MTLTMLILDIFMTLTTFILDIFLTLQEVITMHDTTLTLCVVFLLLAIFGRSSYRSLWSLLSCSAYLASPVVVSAVRHFVATNIVDRLLEILADNRLSIDTVVNERAVRFTVLHCAIPEVQPSQPSVWTWLISHVVSLPSPPEPVREICLPTWSHSVHAGILSAWVFMLGILVCAGVFHLCFQGGKLATAAVKDTMSLVTILAGGIYMISGFSLSTAEAFIESSLVLAICMDKLGMLKTKLWPISEDVDRLSETASDVDVPERDTQKLEDRDDNIVEIEHGVQELRLEPSDSATESNEAAMDDSVMVKEESGEQTSKPLTTLPVALFTFEMLPSSTLATAMSPLEETSTASTPTLTTVALELDTDEESEEAKQMEVVASPAAEEVVFDTVCDEVVDLSHTLSTSESGSGDSEISGSVDEDTSIDSSVSKFFEWSAGEPGPSTLPSAVPDPPQPSLLARIDFGGPIDFGPIEMPGVGPAAPLPPAPQTGGQARGGRGRARGRGNLRGRRGARGRGM